MVFSVIMPVYCVEKYLSFAIESVLAQSFADFELILVDDCSPDGCPHICDVYAQKDPRVRVIHKNKNEGLSAARNTGLAAAFGQYVFFMDSDDSISDELLKKVYAATSVDTQVVVFGFVDQYENKRGCKTWSQSATPPLMHVASDEGIGQAFVRLSRARVFQYAWNKIYRRDFLFSAAIKFESTELIEDFLFNIDVFERAKAVKCIPYALYYYRHPAHQTLATKYSPYFFALSKRKYMLESNFIRKKGVDTDENRQLVAENHIKHVLSTCIRNLSASTNLSFREQCARIKEMLKDDVTKRVLDVYTPSGGFRLVCFFMKHQRVLLCWLTAAFAMLWRQMKPFVKRGMKDASNG